MHDIEQLERNQQWCARGLVPRKITLFFQLCGAHDVSMSCVFLKPRKDTMKSLRKLWKALKTWAIIQLRTRGEISFSFPHFPRIMLRMKKNVVCASLPLFLDVNSNFIRLIASLEGLHNAIMIACQENRRDPSGWRQFLTIKIWTRHKLTFPPHRDDDWTEKEREDIFLEAIYFVLSASRRRLRLSVLWLLAFLHFLSFHHSISINCQMTFSLLISAKVLYLFVFFYFVSRLSSAWFRHNQRAKIEMFKFIICSNMENDIFFLPCWVCYDKKRECLHQISAGKTNFLAEIKKTSWDFRQNFKTKNFKTHQKSSAEMKTSVEATRHIHFTACECQLELKNWSKSHSVFS